MRPVLFSIPLPLLGPVAIKSYGVMLMLGFLIGLYLAVRRAKRENVNPDVVWDMWLYCLLGGILGARVLYYVEHPWAFTGNWWSVIKIWEGGLSFFGGFAAAAVINLIILKVRRIPVLKMYDIVAPSLVLGLAFGKIGCFLNGCCFGDPTTCPLAVHYPVASVIDGSGTLRPSPAFEAQFQRDLAGLHAPQFTASSYVHELQDAGLLPMRTTGVHPVQLYEAGASSIIFVSLLLYFRRRRKYGEVTCLFGVLYGGARFGLEFFRDQPEVLWGLHSSQLLAASAALIFAVVWVWVRKRGRPVTVAGKGHDLRCRNFAA